MIAVNLKKVDVNRIMEIVRELREMGWVQGQDFDFAYRQAQYDNNGWQEVTPKQTMFTFYNEKYASFFLLKYATQ